MDCANNLEVSSLHVMCMNISCKQLSNYLKDIGVGKGDAVVIYLPMLMELPIAMLACARIGAVHSVIQIVDSPPLFLIEFDLDLYVNLQEAALLFSF